MHIAMERVAVFVAVFVGMRVVTLHCRFARRMTRMQFRIIRTVIIIVIIMYRLVVSDRRKVTTEIFE